MAPIETLAQRLAAVAETLRLSELVDFVVEPSRVESCLVGGQDTFGTVEKHISSILIKLNLQEADDDHRRVLAVITFLKAR